MGNRYKVYAWRLYKNVDSGKVADPHYELVYSGNSMPKAWGFVVREKVNGCGCVKFEWR